MQTVKMYATGTCPYCIRTQQILKAKGVEIDEIRVDLDPAPRRHMMAITGRRTVPPIFIAARACLACASGLSWRYCVMMGEPSACAACCCSYIC